MVAAGAVRCIRLAWPRASEWAAARLPRDAELDLTRPWPELEIQVSAALARQRAVTPLTAAVASVRIGWGGALPFVATFLGFVALAADLVRLGRSGPVLVPPGPWSDARPTSGLHR
jgi:hypothetical protein